MKQENAQEAGDLKHQEYVLPAVVIKDPYTWMQHNRLD